MRAGLLKFSVVVILLGMLWSSEVWAEEKSVTSVGTDGETQPSEEKTIQVSQREWLAIQSDLSEIKNQMKKEKEKADQKKKEDEEKKFHSPQTKLGGQILWDACGGWGDTAQEAAWGNDFASGTQCRQAWLWARGTIYDMIEYNLTYDFAGGGAFRDVYIGLKNLPNGIYVKAGHFKEPWSMEELTMVNSSTFMEKSDVNSRKSFVGGRQNGLMLCNWETMDRLGWAVGVFSASQKDGSLNSFYSDATHMAVTTRVHYLPFYEQCPDGRLYMWHLGASYTYRKYDREHAADYGTAMSFRPASGIAPAILNTGNLTGLDSLNGFLMETSWIRGSFSIDAEQAFYFMEDVQAGDVTTQAGFVQASWILTGESRNYVKQGGWFGKITPNNPFIRTCKEGMGVFSGPGAWELCYRFSWNDIGELVPGYDSASTKLGKSFINTIGLNWYWNKNARIMFNYAVAKTEYAGRLAGTEGWTNLFETRFQVTF
ncbi:MAG: porin [Planctomycetia bacterium]|nr:porin [Planctomycetia bacterium]